MTIQLRIGGERIAAGVQKIRSERVGKVTSIIDSLPAKRHNLNCMQMEKMDSANLASFLSGTPVFATMPPEAVQFLVKQSAVKSIAAGEIVFGLDEEVHYTWIVWSGLIRLSSSFIEDKPVTVDLVRPGELFGPIGHVDRDRYLCEASAILPSTVVAVPRSAYSRLLEQYPSVMRAVSDVLEGRLQQAQRFQVMCMGRSKDRLVRILLWLNDKLGDNIPITRRTIAEIACIARETSIRVLTPLEKKGWIQSHRGLLVIRRADKLRGLLHHN